MMEFISSSEGSSGRGLREVGLMGRVLEVAAIVLLAGDRSGMGD